MLLTSQITTKKSRRKVKIVTNGGLFTLRSAKLAWKEDKKKNKGQPWNDNRLVLFCTVDTRFWLADGTQVARKEKEDKLQYAKQYRINIHNWSYGRLIENITTQASKLGIAIAEVKQSVRGSPIEQAKDIAIAFYN